MWFVSSDNWLTLYFTRHDNYPRLNMSYVQQLREVKMDDIYIYHAYTLFLFLAMFQKKHRRGRLHFQEREDDMDMTTSDTTIIIIDEHIFQDARSCDLRAFRFLQSHFSKDYISLR